LALVKGLAYAVGCEVAGFGSLDVLAEGAPDEATRVRVAVEARRDAVYAADYEREARGGPLLRRGVERVVANAEWLESLRPGDLAIGPAVERRREEWAWPAGVELAGAERCWPTVEGLARVGRAAWAGGGRLEVAGVEPTYLSASAAEEKAASAGAWGA
jgi:tRNA A37 threonylcarbamoyladenosine modification protein TsaB